MTSERFAVAAPLPTRLGRTTRPSAPEAEDSRRGTRTTPGQVDRHPGWALATASATYATLAFALFRHTWVDPAHRLVGWCCDAASSVGLLNVTASATAHLHDPLLSHALAAPSGFNMMWQPSGVPLLGLLATPVEPLLGAVATYNLFATLAIAASGLACYVALRRWVGGVVGPLVGGLVYEFSPYMAAHSLGHLNLTSAFIPPLAFLVLGNVVSGVQSPRLAGIAVGGLAGAQLLLSEELFITTAMLAVVVLVVLALSRPAEVRSRLAPLGRCLGVALVTFAIVSAAPLAVQLLGPGRIHGLIRPQNRTVTDLANVVLPTGITQYSPPGSSAVNAWNWEVSEMTAYLGPLLLVATAAIAVVRWRSLVVRCALVGALAALVLSLGPSLHFEGVDRHIPMPWAVVGHLPILKNVLPARFAVLVYLGVAVVIAEGLTTLIRARRWWAPVGVVGIGLALAPLTPLLSYPTTAAPVPAFFSDGARAIRPGSTVFVAPVPRDQPTNIAPMLWQAATDDRFDMEAGYVLLPVPSGPGLALTGGAQDELTARLDALAAGATLPPLRPGDAQRLRTILFRTYRPDAVVVGPMARRDDAIGLLTTVIGHPPERRGGVAVWLHLDAMKEIRLLS